MKRIAKLAVFFAVFAVLFYGAGEVMKSNDGAVAARIKGFYKEPENSLDVVLLGASDVYTSFSPGLAYEEFGFTSYPYAVNSNPASLWISQIKEIRKRQDPKVIVVEINGAVSEKGRYQSSKSTLGNYLDNIPLSLNWAETIDDVVPDDQKNDFRFRLFKYHDSWRHPDKWAAYKGMLATININGQSYLKGMKTITTRFDVGDVIDLHGDDSTDPLEKLAEGYLREFLQYLKDNEINNVLFIRVPHRTVEESYNRYQKSNRAGEIIEEYGYTFLNCEKIKSEIGIKSNEDFYNNEHLNVDGCRKFTEFFGNYLVENYDLKDVRHSGEIISEWDKSAEVTRKFFAYCDDMIARGIKVETTESLLLLSDIERY